VENGSVTAPLWTAAGVATSMTSNQAFLRDYVYRMLVSAFPNLAPCVLPLAVCLGSLSVCLSRVGK
jgi:hypothetical protein